MESRSVCLSWGRILPTASSSHKYREVFFLPFLNLFLFVLFGHHLSYFYFQLSSWYFNLFNIFLSLIFNMEYLGHNAPELSSNMKKSDLNLLLEECRDKKTRGIFGAHGF